ncbi:hypothetical protein GCM10011390_30570 [Aureimonas endophytica]|uniref:Uncharacterized protein n=1 Tax=Aureimonas endophytica TaxID=2027858 RepID=A0A917E6J4_9HYPH|nr:hypothetical protein [Aureimonas endophytica]GGE09369.1 hypothetical protein GCM10011390_30570 [Aureimonas endophytica]
MLFMAIMETAERDPKALPPLDICQLLKAQASVAATSNSKRRSFEEDAAEKPAAPPRRAKSGG